MKKISFIMIVSLLIISLTSCVSTGFDKELLTKENVELAKIMARRYFCNISECIKLMLPPGEKTTNLENRIKGRPLDLWVIQWTC